MSQLRLFESEDLQDKSITWDESASPWEILDRINWDFTGEVTQYLTHTFHSYPARFIPQIPNLLIQLFTSEGETVLDPFMGCGTTLVEAMMLNRKAIGVDMNPLACLIGKVKTTLIDESDLMRLWTSIARIQYNADTHPQPSTLNDNDAKLPNRKISQVFTPAVIAELQAIEEHIEELKGNEALFNLALVALSSTIRVVVESGRQSGIVDLFRQKIRVMIDALVETNKRVHSPDVTIIHGDARKLTLPGNSVDLVVTSPPYVNALDYYRVHQYNMAWLGMDYAAFQRKEIGGHSHFIMNRFRLLSEYLGDMLRAMLEMSRVLKPSGICTIVIGNSSLEYELIESHKFFATMSHDVGFTVKRRFFRNIDTSKKYHNQKVGKIDDEYILILQKEADPPTTSADDEFVANIVRREMLHFKAQVDASPGSSLRGKKVSAARLRENSKRLEAAIATIEKDIKHKR